MHSVYENLTYWIRHSIAPKRAVIAHILKSMAVIILIASALEVFVFNFNYFASAGLNTIDLHDRIDLPEDPDENFRLTSYDHSLEFYNLNTEVKNIRVDFVLSQPAQNVELSIHFTDSAHQTYFDSTEYTVGIPDVVVATSSLQSQYINLNTSGLVGNLAIDVVNADEGFPILLNTVELNAHHPFIFSWLRFSICAFVLLLIFMFRPRSAIYRISIVDNAIVSKVGIVSAVVVECMLVTTFLLFGSNLVGVATSNYNYGEWDGYSLVNTFEVGGDNAQQYAELARSMADGKLYLEEEPPQWLQEMDDPYDKGARDEAQKETGEDYLFDVAYHDGHYYVYFGVVPVVLFYLPFYLITGANFPTAIGVLIAVLAFILGTSALLDRFARYHFKKVSLGLYLLLQIGLIASCGILYLVKFPTFYSLPIACGLAFSVWGLYLWMRGRDSRHRCICFLAGSLCMALVVGCRPQFIFLSLLAFPLFWRSYITQRRILTKKGMKEFVCLIAPYLLVAACIMAYNHARFGSFTDFGANYNLTVNDMTKRGWNVGRLAPAFFAYFLQTPNTTGIFPFLQPVDFATTYMGQTIKEATFGGIFACFPILWILLFARPIVKIRNAQRSTRTITGVIIVLVLSGFAIALMDAQMAGILQRYYADFSFMFLAAIVLLVFIVNENVAQDIPARRTSKGAGRKKGSVRLFEGVASHFAITDRSAVKRTPNGRRKPSDALSEAGMMIPAYLSRDLMTKALIALVAMSVLYSFLLCLTPETGWYSDVYPWAYHDLLESFLFWT